MSQEFEDEKRVTNVRELPLSQPESLRQDMSWCRAEDLADHFWLANQPFMEMTLQSFILWLEQKTKPIRFDYRSNMEVPTQLNPEWVSRINQIWWGKIWLYQKRNRNYDIIKQHIAFEYYPNLRYREEMLEIPSLRDMNPQSKTKDDTNPKILIRDVVDFKDVYLGYDPTQIAQRFGFMWKFIDKVVPMFKTDEDVANFDGKVIEVTREYFHKLIKIEKRTYDYYKIRLWDQMHRILIAESSASAFGKYAGEGAFNTSGDFTVAG